MSLSTDTLLRIARALTHDKLRPGKPHDGRPDDPESDGNGFRESGARTGRWELKELEARIREELGVEVELRPSRNPLRSLLASGQIVAFEGGRYTEYTTPVEGMTRLTLLDLLRRAADEVDLEHEASRGSQSADDRCVEALTESQFSHIKTACNRIGRHVSGDRRDRDEKFHPALMNIGSEHFVWDPNAGRRQMGDWKKLLDLVRTAAPSKSTSQYVGSVRRLMDLAATHGWIARTPVHDRHYAPVPVDWAPLYNRWREALRGEIDQLKTGLMELFEACYRHDQKSPEDADWRKMIDRLEERFDANGVPSQRRTIVRRTYRAARAAGLLTGPEWDGRRYRNRKSVSLVPAGDRRAVADLYGQDGPQNGIRAALNGQLVPWPGDWSTYPGLVGGPYGLRKLLHYATVPSSKIEKLGVPDRGLYPGERIRDTGPKSHQGWARGTVHMRLEHLCHCAGWMAQEHNVDWSQEDLRTLLREDYLRGYKSYLEDECEGGTKTIIKRFGTLARLASPYLESVAVKEGDEDLANRMAHLSKLISSPDSKVDGGRSWIARWRSQSKGDRIEELRRVAKRVERTWSRSGRAASCAYIQLRRVLGGRLELLEEDYGPLTSQVAAVQAGAERVRVDGRDFHELDRSWAKTVRDLVYWADQLIVPLRVDTSMRLDVSDRLENGGFTHLRARIHKDKRKPDSPVWFRPNYYRGDGGYPANLYQLYRMDGGARERLLTLRCGRVANADAFYVHDLQGQAKTARMSTDSFRRLTRRVVKKLLERRPEILSPGLETPITLEELTAPDHVLATHMFRHAFARYWVREQNDLHTASAYLDHSDHKMLLDVYLGEDESDLNPAAKMAYLPGG